MKPKPEKSAESCRRCGTCCKKGGPTFHLEDKALIESGAIPLSALFTLRKGELVRDQIRGVVLPLKQEIIKLKGKGDRWTCFCFDEHENRCRIYADRPLECRLLQCWDSTGIERVYEKNRLTRRDLLGEIEGLWELVADHEKRCAYKRLAELIEAENSTDKHGLREVVEMVGYDAELRTLLAERSLAGPEVLPFLLGRPMLESLKGFGIEVEQKGGKKLLKLKKTKVE